jgi:UDP-glucose 4-epimerase
MTGKKKVLITGGAGFIGSHLVDRLLSKGDEVICVDNFLLGKNEHLKDALKNDRFELHNFDLLEMDKLDSLFKEHNFDFVYHLAANSNIQNGYMDINVDYNNTFLSTYNILTVMKEYDVKNIVFASSSAVYGNNKNILKENSGPLMPISNYGAAKLASEAYISSYCECYNLKSWIIRFPNVVGWRLTHGIVHDFVNKLKENPNELLILGNGKQTKPYLFISDLLNAFEKIIEVDSKKVQLYNVSSDSLSNVDYIADMVINQLSLKNVNIRYSGGEVGWIGDVSKFSYDTSKIQKLGWSSRFSSDDAIKESIKKEILFRELKVN